RNGICNRDRLIFGDEAREKITSIAATPNQSQFSYSVAVLEEESRTGSEPDFANVHFITGRDREECCRICRKLLPKVACFRGIHSDNSEYSLQQLVQRKSGRRVECQWRSLSDKEFSVIPQHARHLLDANHDAVPGGRNCNITGFGVPQCGREVAHVNLGLLTDGIDHAKLRYGCRFWQSWPESSPLRRLIQTVHGFGVRNRIDEDWT